MKLLRRLWCALTSHVAWWDDIRPRDEHGLVSIECRRCGAVLWAEYGIALPVTWRRP